jgi:hypothetical protein
MRIAGVYASAFLFYFFIFQVQRRETKFLCMCRNEKQKYFLYAHRDTKQ